jgi:prepilin-type N-terminal cleavage/methylation domain-containing protein
MSTMQPARGVTLVELLVSLAIAAIVLLPLTDMLRSGADSARFVRAGLDQNADARFVINRIAAQAASITTKKPGPGEVGEPAAWLAPLQYAVQNGALVEIDTDPKSAHTSVLLTGVRSFETTIPEIGAGATLLRIELVLDRPDCQPGAAQACTVSYARTVRAGSRP